eukprot:Hpha_TRINITY_DN15957_c2_g4::TRINITY_DN15957_c2_g4_i1::g.73203::m.73203
MGSPGRCSPNRLARDEASALIGEQWAPHEVRLHQSCEVEAGSPPRWDTQLLSYPDLGPSDSAYALANRNRPPTAPTRDPAADLAAINERLAADEFGNMPSEGDGWRLPSEAPVPLQRLFVRGETRTPLVVPSSLLGLSAEETITTIQNLGRGRVENTIVLDLAAEAQRGDVTEACEKMIERAIAEGLWLVVHQPTIRKPHAQGDTACGELAFFPAYRKMALSLMTTTPEGESLTGLFRLWVVVPEPVDLNETNFPTFPTVFVQHALQLTPSEVESSGKVVRKMPADPIILEQEVSHREKRKFQGREVDAETLEGEAVENLCGERKLTGPIFVRSLEMYHHTSPGRVRQRIEFAHELGSNVDD